MAGYPLRYAADLGGSELPAVSRSVLRYHDIFMEVTFKIVAAYASILSSFLGSMFAGIPAMLAGSMMTFATGMFYEITEQLIATGEVRFSPRQMLALAVRSMPREVARELTSRLELAVSELVPELKTALDTIRENVVGGQTILGPYVDLAIMSWRRGNQAVAAANNQLARTPVQIDEMILLTG
jgi:hypothetical protein